MARFVVWKCVNCGASVSSLFVNGRTVWRTWCETGPWDEVHRAMTGVCCGSPHYGSEFEFVDLEVEPEVEVIEERLVDRFDAVLERM